MYIKNFEIHNYKSFLRSGQVSLTDDFNIVVGPNNVGKTALAEALSLRFENRAHRSFQTAPTPATQQTEHSSITVTFQIERAELIRMFGEGLDGAHGFVPNGITPQVAFNEFDGQIRRAGVHNVSATFSPNQVDSAAMLDLVHPLPDVPETGTINTFVIRMDPIQQTLVYGNHGHISSPHLLLPKLALLLKQRIYRFESSPRSSVKGLHSRRRGRSA